MYVLFVRRGAAALAKELRRNTALTKLDLSSNVIGDTGVCMFVRCACVLVAQFVESADIHTCMYTYAAI